MLGLSIKITNETSCCKNSRHHHIADRKQRTMQTVPSCTGGTEGQGAYSVLPCSHCNDAVKCCLDVNIWDYL